MLDITLLFGSLVGWILLLKVIQWKWGLTTSTASYAVSFCHGLFVTRAAEYVIYTEGVWSADKIGGPVTPLQNTILTVSLGYFIYDTYICFTIDETLVIKCHHVLATIIFIGTLLAEKSGPEVIVCSWCGEFTNMFLNLRFFFNNYQGGHRFNIPLTMLNDVMFVVWFVVLRFGIGSFVIYHILTSGRSLAVLKFGALGFTAVNLVLGRMIVQEVLKMLGSLFSPKQPA